MIEAETARHSPAGGTRRGWVSDPVVWSMLPVFAVVRLLEVVASKPVIYADTHTYWTGRFLDFSLTSLDGRSVRPWGATAWMALWPSARAMVVANAALSVVAWSALAISVAAVIQRPGVRRGVVVLLLVLACTAQVANWDLAMICESVSISSGILALAAVLHFAAGPSWGRGAMLLAAALWFSMTRPNVFPVLVAWAVVLVVVGVVTRRLLPSAVVAAVLIGVSLYSYVYNVRSDPIWRSAWLGVTRTTVSYGYPVSSNNPVADAVLADVRKSGAPRCMIPASPQAVTSRGTTQWVVETAKACPGMDAWATANWNRWWLDWLLHHPDLAARIVRVQLPNALSAPIHAGVTAAVPDSISSLYFGSSALPQAAVASRTYRTEPLLLWLAVAGAFAILCRRRSSDGRWHLDLLLLVGAFGALVSAISSTLLIQAGAAGVGRESVGVTVVLTASCVALAGLGLDRFLTSGA